MCYKTSQKKTVQELQDEFDVRIANPDLIERFNKPRYHINGFAHPFLLAIPQVNPNMLSPMSWGIVPPQTALNDVRQSWKDARAYGEGLNARSEKAFSNYVYKESITTRRCAIPVSGFFEPHHFKSKSYPVYISRKDDRSIPLAGIYTSIGNYAFVAILTKDASPMFRDIHNKKNREPLMLTRNNLAKWLANDTTESEIKDIMKTGGFDNHLLQAHTISKDLYKLNLDTDIPSILDKVEHKGLKTDFAPPQSA